MPFAGEGDCTGFSPLVLVGFCGYQYAFYLFPARGQLLLMNSENSYAVRYVLVL